MVHARRAPEPTRERGGHASPWERARRGRTGALSPRPPTGRLGAPCRGGSSRPPPRPRGSGFAPAVPVLGHTHCVCAGTAVVFRKATHARRLPHGRGSGVLLVFPPSCLLDPPSSLFACRRSRASRKLLGRGAWAAPPSRLCFATCLYLTPARRLEMILPRNGRAFSRRGAVSHVTETSRVLFSGFILPPPLSRPATRSRSFWDLPPSLALNRTMTRSGTELLEAVSF